MSEEITDTERLDWLERNLLHLSHDRATSSVDMSGRCIRGQMVNEGKAGHSRFRVNHRSIRDAVDEAMGEKLEEAYTPNHQIKLWVKKPK